MAEAGMVMYEEEFKHIDAELSKLHQQANAKVTFLVDKNGQLIASVGDTQNLDTTSLASLTAGNIAATGGMARLLGEREFSILFHEGERDNIHISMIGQRVILVVVFDQRSSLGLVRLRVKKSVEVFTQIFDRILKKIEKETGKKVETKSPFAEITEEDIEKLFG
jgi:predicted regulator of Ras-like GTPase activity (Roadblock/LC7/MglB family)